MKGRVMPKIWARPLDCKELGGQMSKCLNLYSRNMF